MGRLIVYLETKSVPAERLVGRTNEENVLRSIGTFGVLLRVGAAELNFCKSALELVLFKSALSLSTNVTTMLSRSAGGDEEDI